MDIFYSKKIKKEEALQSLLDISDRVDSAFASTNDRVIMSDNYNQLIEILGPRLNGFISVKKQTTGNYILWDIPNEYKIRKELKNSKKFRYIMYAVYFMIIVFLCLFCIKIMPYLIAALVLFMVIYKAFK